VVHIAKVFLQKSVCFQRFVNLLSCPVLSAFDFGETCFSFRPQPTESQLHNINRVETEITT